jgi:hypothetical protein
MSQAIRLSSKTEHSGISQSLSLPSGKWEHRSVQDFTSKCEPAKTAPKKDSCLKDCIIGALVISGLVCTIAIALAIKVSLIALFVIALIPASPIPLFFRVVILGIGGWCIIESIFSKCTRPANQPPVKA